MFWTLWRHQALRIKGEKFVKKVLILLFTFLILLSVVCVPVNAAVEINEENESYVFDTNMHTVDAPTAYTATKILYSKDFGESERISPDDLSVGPNGSIYVADGEASKVYKISPIKRQLLQ